MHQHRMIQIPEPIARMMSGRSQANPVTVPGGTPQPTPIPVRKCNNCETPITCGCQKRVASDGREVCDECLEGYEKSLSDGLGDQD